MKAINNEVIEAVRSRAGILDVVSEVVVLKRVGKDYKGLCPFHKEKTPSFYVNPEKGIFKCFGCGEGGDIFTFVQKAKGLDFLDGVKQLANQYGISLIETEEEKNELSDDEPCRPREASEPRLYRARHTDRREQSADNLRLQRARLRLKFDSPPPLDQQTPRSRANRQEW